MTQRAVEIVLGRLATDEAVRRRFSEAPGAALRDLIEMGLELSAVELLALQSLEVAAVQRFAQVLDPRLQKAVLVRSTAAVDPGMNDGEESA